ncbi:MAG: FAD-dependent oxidoreductase, partial [Candidatus Atribacteria bacterium]|nr:FAD-dependent oxidoreductase [Candidatus Atribacteria bacterium]
ILACGSKPIIPNIPGLINSDHVITAHEMLRKDMILKKKNIVVIGGGLVGCETAEYLKFHDNQVTIVEMLADIALDVNPVYREDILERLAKNKIRILTSTRLEEIQRNLDKYVVINRKENGEIESIDCDDVVLACGARPNRELEVVLKPYFNDYYLVGDCNCPGKILDAVYHSATTLIHLID